MSGAAEPAWTRETARLKEHFDLLIEMNDKRYGESSLSDRRALLSGLAESNRRLDALAEARGATNDAIGRMITREEYEAGRQNNRDKMDQQQSAWEARFSAEIRPLEAKLDTIGRTNWPLMASLISVFLVIVGGVWVLIGLKIEATLAPVSMTLEQVRTVQVNNVTRINKLDAETSTSMAADVQSQTDRAQLNGRVKDLEAAMASESSDRRAIEAAAKAKLTEIETQFCGGDIVRNLMHASDMRVAAVMWRKLFPEQPIPTDNAYYPRICNRGASD